MKFPPVGIKKIDFNLRRFFLYRTKYLCEKERKKKHLKLDSSNHRTYVSNVKHIGILYIL